MIVLWILQQSRNSRIKENILPLAVLQFAIIEFMSPRNLLIKFCDFLQHCCGIFDIRVLNGNALWGWFEHALRDLLMSIFYSFTRNFTWICHQKLSNLLNVSFREPLPHAVLLSRFQSIGPIIERNLFMHTRLIIDIKDVIVLPSFEILIARVVLRFSHASITLVIFSYNLANLLPSTVLPHVGFRNKAVLTHSDLAFFLALDGVQLCHGGKFVDLLRTHAWFLWRWV